MRWNNFFDDLESQLEGELALEAEQSRAHEDRLRFARMTLRQALSVAGGATLPAAQRPALFLDLPERAGVRLQLLSLGRDWLSALHLDSSSERQFVIPLSSIHSLKLDRRLPATPPPEPGEAVQLSERISLQFLLRDLARRQKPLLVHTRGGTVSGTLTRAASDFVELATRDWNAETAAPGSETPSFRIIPLATIAFLEFG